MLRAMVRSGPGFNTTTHAHNEFPQMIVEHGVVVSGALLFALGVVVRTGLAAFGHGLNDQIGAGNSRASSAS